MKIYQWACGALAVAAAGLLMSTQITTAQDNSNQSSDNIFDNLNLVKGDLPTGVAVDLPGVQAALFNLGTDQNSDQAPKQNRIMINVGGKLIYENFDNSAYNGTRANVTTTIGIRVGALSADAQLDLSRLITEQLNSDYEDRGDTIYDGISEINAKTLNPEAILTLDVVRFGFGKDMAVLSIYAGNGQVLPTAEFLMSTQVAASFLDGAEIDQTSQVGISVAANNWTVKLAAFGESWGSYWGDKDRFQTVTDNNDGLRSFAVSADANFGPVDAYVGYAHLDKFINPNDPSFAVKSGDQFTAGALWHISDTVRVAGELVNFSAKDSSSNQDMTALRVKGEYDLGRSLTVGADYEQRIADNSDIEGKKFGGSIAYHIADNASLVLEVAEVWPENGSSRTMVSTMFNLQPQSEDSLPVLNKDTSTEPSAQQAVDSAMK